MQQMEYSRGDLFHESPREVPQGRELYQQSKKSLTVRSIGEETTRYLKAAVTRGGSKVPVTRTRCVSFHEAEDSKVADLS